MANKLHQECSSKKNANTASEKSQQLNCMKGKNCFHVWENLIFLFPCPTSTMDVQGHCIFEDKRDKTCTIKEKNSSSTTTIQEEKQDREKEDDWHFVPAPFSFENWKIWWLHHFEYHHQEQQSLFQSDTHVALHQHQSCSFGDGHSYKMCWGCQHSILPEGGQPESGLKVQWKEVGNTTLMPSQDALQSCSTMPLVLCDYHQNVFDTTVQENITSFLALLHFSVGHLAVKEPT
mmetsp:Transcript_21918/g.36264  ORF Transcript_21918/g.36264 Transcript_21918/m.36264 type:complete len:233 (+) Transcript_21918:242-940(+)